MSLQDPRRLNLAAIADGGRQRNRPAVPQQQQARELAAFEELLRSVISPRVMQTLGMRCIWGQWGDSSVGGPFLGAYASFSVDGVPWSLALAYEGSGIIWLVIPPVHASEFDGHMGYGEGQSSLGEETVERFLLSQVLLWQEWKKRTSKRKPFWR